MAITSPNVNQFSFFSARKRTKFLTVRTGTSNELVVHNTISRIYRVNKYGDNAEPYLVLICMVNDSDIQGGSKKVSC